MIPRPDVSELPRAEFAFPGPLRDQLVEAILNGRKTSTTSLKLQYEVEDEPLPDVNERSLLVDSAERSIAVLETTGVHIVALADVDLAHVLDEGEGYETVKQWRAAHEQFFQSASMRLVLQLPHFTVDDTTLVVLERFEVVELLS